jgi:hypothetical protein
MDLLLFLLAFIIGFGMFVSSAYFLAKLMFPRLEDEESVDFGYPTAKRNYMPRINKNTNPYFFPKNHPYSYK